MGKHLVICGHGQGRSGYDPGAVNRQLNITEAGKVREFANLMKQYSAGNIDYVMDQNVYDYQSLASIGKGYDSITELHFNAFNGQARGTEILIYSGYNPDSLDQKLLGVLSKRFTNRGFKKVNWLYNANVAASRGYNYRLVEIAFIDNNSDMAIYEQHKVAIAQEFVHAITGQTQAPVITPSRPSHLNVGDSVVVQVHATHYQTGQAISKWVKGKTYQILQVKSVTQSNSRYAYLLGGIKSWVLEQDVKATTKGHSERTYTVQKGDTLYGIAKKFNTSATKLSSKNKITNPSLIRVGQVIHID